MTYTWFSFADSSCGYFFYKFIQTGSSECGTQEVFMETTCLIVQLKKETIKTSNHIERSGN